MKCSFCSYEFDEKHALSSCAGCSKLSNCTTIKCPRCGYKVPPEPKWLKRIFNIFNKEKVR